MIRLATTYGAVASTGAAAWVGWGQGQAQLAGAVILAALAFLAVRLWILGGVDLGARLPRRDTVASILLVGMIVTAGVAGPMAQPVQAAEAGNCSDLDDFVMFLTLGVVNGNECSRQAYVEDAIADYEQTDAEQTKVDIYSQASALKQHNQNYLTQYDNYLNDTENVAWSKMQVAVAEAYKNDSTEIQAKNAAANAIEDYYAVKQRNMIAAWNTQASEFAYLHNQATQETNVSGNFAAFYSGQSSGETGYWGTQNNTVTLANGTTATVKQFKAPNNGYLGLTAENTDQYSDSVSAFTVKKPTSAYDSDVSIDPTTWRSRWDRSVQKEDALVQEAQTYVNATYDDYQAGTVNASDVISANTAMFEYGTRSNNETESLYDSVGALALSGFDTPTLNGTGTMDVVYNNNVYTGMVMARNVPNGSWEVNTTYDSANFDGPVFIVTTTGEKIDVSGTFRIEEMRAQDGSSISSVNTTRYNYKTTNATELLEVQSRLTSLRQELEERQPSGGGGGIGGIGDSKAIIAIIAGVAVLLLTRD